MRQTRNPERQKSFVQRKNRVNLSVRMIGLIGLLIVVVTLICGVFFHYFISETLEQRLGEEALSIAESIALNPDISEAFREEDPSATIQPLVKPIQQATNAEFIVVGNRDEIRYSHPEPSLIGKRMVGEDNERALIHGESYVSQATGTLGNSLRAKVPVYLDGEIVGVVSVGFLAENIQQLISSYRQELWLTLVVIALFAALAATGIATYIKRLLHGLEPEEISYLLFQKETILQSTREGIIAVNERGEITLLNERARQLLFGDGASGQLEGTPIRDVLPNSDLPDILMTQERIYDKEQMYGNHEVYVNSGPIYYQGELVGAVSTFRNKDEIEKMTKELSRIRQYANALRAQTHEFSNKLYTISGLLHLNKKQEVLDFIHSEQNTQQEWIRRLIDKVSDPLISGILIGKINQASEQQVELKIDPDSSLHSELTDPQREALLAAIGNFTDNAIESVKSQPEANRRLSMYFTDIGEDILLEIDDSGSGIDEEGAARLFEQGYSTKAGADRGYGLHTVQQLAAAAGGCVFLEESELGGACFVVSLPKEGKQL